MAGRQKALMGDFIVRSSSTWADDVEAEEAAAESALGGMVCNPHDRMYLVVLWGV